MTIDAPWTRGSSTEYVRSRWSQLERYLTETALDHEDETVVGSRLLRILLVEDEPINVEVVREALRESEINHELAVVRDGLQALDHLLERDLAGELPDLILLDLNTPRIDGFEVLEELRGDADFAGIPVMVVSSSTADADIRRSIRLGAAAYVSKPEGFDDLDRLVSALQAFSAQQSE